jgi:predicted acylesterase/phospholipase RssA
VRDADVVIAVTRNGPDRDWFARGTALRDCELICVDTPLTDAMLEAFAPREVQVIRGQTGWDNAIAGTARRLAGRSVGLVLSGGGARALAHLGVLDELQASGIRIDRLAGASMGAIVTGIAATGASLDEITALFENSMVESNPSNDYTLPAYSLIRGQKTRRLLESAFGDLRVEELPKRWYSVSCDLISRELVVHRTGRLVDAIYPSMALPGIFPPMPAPGGRLLVDGGVMNNLPVEPMAQRGEGPIIAVDVSQRAGPILPSSRPRVERVARRVRQLLAGSETPLPPVRETILRTIALGSTDTVAAAMRHADIVIQPRVEGYGLLDWKNLPRVREAGRQATREALAPMMAEIESWT